MKRPRIGVNFYKVVVGVGFSLLWAKVMYLAWPNPSYVTFIWFYLIIGSVLLKWVFFGAIDRIHLKIRLGAAQKELEESGMRVEESGRVRHQEAIQQVSLEKINKAAFDERLNQLLQEVSAFGGMVERAIERSIESITKRDIRLATEVIAGDNKLDQRRFVIEGDCMQLIASGHATDSDLRAIVAVLGIATELERMGDYAKGIANITLMMGEEPSLELPMEIPQMAQKGIEMLRGSLESLAAGDVERAKRICRKDDEVDGLYDQAFRELLLFIIAHPEAVTQATRMIWVAHNLERFADRVTNICEQVVLSVTGQLVDIGVSEY